jgi:hypothetical protein
MSKTKDLATTAIENKSQSSYHTQSFLNSWQVEFKGKLRLVTLLKCQSQGQSSGFPNINFFFGLCNKHECQCCVRTHCTRERERERGKRERDGGSIGVIGRVCLGEVRSKEDGFMIRERIQQYNIYAK